MTVFIVAVCFITLLSAAILAFRKIVVRFGETLAGGIFRGAGRRWAGKK